MQMGIWLCFLLIILVIVYAILVTKSNRILGALDSIVINDLKSGIIQYIDMDTTKTYKTRNDLYVDPKSNQQIKQLARHGSVGERARLYRLLCPDGNIEKFLRYSRMNDSDVYAAIGKTPTKNVASRAEFHAGEIYRILSNYIGDSDTNIRYLDYGCGDGSITSALASRLGVTAPDCVDMAAGTTAGVNFSVVNDDVETLPYPDNTFDIITARFSLHHIKNLDQIVGELYRIAAPGCIFAIVEHDCWNFADAILVDITHGMYMHNADDYGHARSYKNRYGWNEQLSQWKCLYNDYYYAQPRPEQTPTRDFIAVYKKES